MLCSECVILLLIPLFAVVHLFIDLLLFNPVTIIAMRLVSATMIADLNKSIFMTTEVMCYESHLVVVALMLDQFDPFIVFQF